MTRDEILKSQRILAIGRTFALVDPEDFETLRKRDWQLKRRGNGTLFALTRIKYEHGLQTWYLHHAVCTRAHGPRPGPDWACEAINGDSLDCRRENLRWRRKLALKLEAMRKGLERKRAAA